MDTPKSRPAARRLPGSSKEGVRLAILLAAGILVLVALILLCVVGFILLQLLRP